MNALRPSPTQSNGLTRPLTRKAALSHHVGHDLPSLGGRESFCENIRHRRILQRHVDIGTLQLAVLLLQLLEPFDVRRPTHHRSLAARL